MKGGLVVILHALSAFEQLACAKQIGWDILITGDEEIGSPASSQIIDTIAPQYQAAFVYEPAMDADGTLAKNRRGSGKFTLIATGKSAHVGRAFDEGRNAIAYLAEALVAIHALNYQQHPGVTFNIGKIAGGDALNVVPDQAIAQLDIRITTTEDEIWVHQQLHTIMQQLERPDYQLTLHGGFHRPVKSIDAGTERLFHRIQAQGKILGLSLQWKDSGGCCDGNNLARHHIPVIDTLGVRGGNIHSQEEYILLDSLPERSALSLLILNDLAMGGLEELSL
jgi:glutamate carboxypeptidase